MGFQEIGTRKKSIEIAQQILASIRGGSYQVGDRLPSEEEIARMTGTSRPSVREALGALQIVGIVEAKAGSGTYVRKSLESPEIESEVLQLLNEEGAGLFEILEARQMIEKGIAEYVANNLRSIDLERIKGSVDRMKDAIENKDWDEYRKANRDFHLSIVAVTKNAVMKDIVTSLLDMRKGELWKRMNIWVDSSSLDKVMQSFTEHQNILFALEAGDTEIIKQRIDEHIEGTVERLRMADGKI